MDKEQYDWVVGAVRGEGVAEGLCAVEQMFDEVLESKLPVADLVYVGLNVVPEVVKVVLGRADLDEENGRRANGVLFRALRVALQLPDESWLRRRCRTAQLLGRSSLRTCMSS